MGRGRKDGVGGGILRDVLIGRTPPMIFTRAWLLLLSIGVSLAVFLLAYFFRTAYAKWTAPVEHVNNYFDAVGLAAFSVMGTEVAFSAGVSSSVTGAWTVSSWSSWLFFCSSIVFSSLLRKGIN